MTIPVSHKYKDEPMQPCQNLKIIGVYCNIQNTAAGVVQSFDAGPIYIRAIGYDEAGEVVFTA